MVGAGLMGRLIGWQCVKKQHQVTLYERASRNTPRSAAHVAASLLASTSERPESDDAYMAMARSSRDVWRSWCDELSVPYAFDGTLVVAHPVDVSLLEKFETTLRRHRIPEFVKLGGPELQEVEPVLASHFRNGILLETEGWLDNRALLDALESRCGNILYEHSIEPEDLSADCVIDCRGAGSTNPEVRAIRGEIIRLFAPEVNFIHPIRLLHPKYRVYIAPRPNHQYVVGATQIESDIECGVTVQGALELLSAAYSVNPGFQDAEITEIATGLRAAFDDNLPRVQWHSSVLEVNGLYRHGYSIGPAIVGQAMEQIQAYAN
ncbi:MAG: FAD-dependent oxidoreductase [Gammaproteobacteria bacterium]|nr:FAD-dependent oxidoreductase [Gammaproteobacteria bacterium]MDE0252010.1 FAD-dependent oxidoreductase [Gammaproteobacteria bacterium]MDE0402882.1 FAD-dependent oxidoreductase [Gammaproteobacteria bacterium]